jgi:hypothetical protein
MTVNTAIFPETVVWSVGLFRNITNGESQNAILNGIFARLAANEITRRNEINNFPPTLLKVTSPTFIETVLTLYRLYHDQQWEEARVYFYLITGILMNRDESEITLNLANYSRHQDEENLNLDPLTINGQCDRDCSLLNELWFDSKDYYNEDEDDDDDDDDDEEESSRGSEDGSDGSGEHVDNDEVD